MNWVFWGGRLKGKMKSPCPAFLEVCWRDRSRRGSDRRKMDRYIWVGGGNKENVGVSAEAGEAGRRLCCSWQVGKCGQFGKWGLIKWEGWEGVGLSERKK